MAAAAPSLRFPERTSLYPEDGVPSAVLTPQQALRSLPRRADLVRPSYMPDAARQHLVFFLQHAEVLPRSSVRPRHLADRAQLDPLADRNAWTPAPGQENAATDDGWWEGRDAQPEEEMDEEDEEDGDGAQAKAREARRRAVRREDVVVLSGVTQEGVSVAVAVQHWRQTFYLMPSERMAERDPSLAALQLLVREMQTPVEADVVMRPQAYGYRPDAANPGERRLYPFLRVRVSSQYSLRRLCSQLEGLLSGSCALEDLAPRRAGEGQDGPRKGVPPALFSPPSQGLRGALHSCRAMGGATTEEGDRLKPEFKFLDEHEIPPASWVVVPRGKYRLIEAWERAFSFRTLNALVEDPAQVMPMEKLLASERAAESLRTHAPLPPPDPNTVPPSLFAYADIESRSADPAEFPDPTHPEAPCYMVGVSFVWAFSLPPALQKAQTGAGGSGSPWLEERLRAVDDEMGRRRDEAVAAVWAARAERLRRRAERSRRYAAREDVLRLLGGDRDGVPISAGEMNSDDESDGEGAAVSRAEKDVAKDADAERARLRAMASGKVWERAGRGGSGPDHGRPASEAMRAEGTLSEAKVSAAGPGAMMGHPCLRVLLVLGECAPIPGAVVVAFPGGRGGERMLLHWLRALLFGIMDVDGIRGYNWLGFDSRYIVRRAELYGIADPALRWSHIPSRPPMYDRHGEMTLKLAKGIFRMVRLHGTNTVDMMVYMRQQLDLASYKLESIAEHFGVEGKHPIKPEHIFAAYGGTPDQRAVVGAYCLRDCDVLADIARAAQFEVTLMQFARIMQTQAETMWTSGQQIRVVHQLIWQAHRQGFVVDGLFRDRRAEDRALRVLASGKSFSGGFVMKPAVAHYLTPTATLDFKSLYPSIMISHKLCYSTALLAPFDSPEWVDRIRRAGREVIRIETESGTFHYVQHPTNIIPDMEWTLWCSRQAIKKEMKRAADALLVAVLDAKQLAVKVSMNSTFGVTGAEHAMLGMKRIAASITHVGRTTVQAARDHADALAAQLAIAVPALPGAQETITLPVLAPGVSLRTVYGDTDSIMVNLPAELHPDAVAWAGRYIDALGAAGSSPAAAGSPSQPSPSLAQPSLALALRDPATAPRAAAILLLVCRYVGQVITDALNGGYRKPMEIEFEEVASQAIFLAPKMYTKNVVEDMDDAVIRKLAAGGRIGKLKVAGIAAKRRDRSMVTKRLQKGVAAAIVHHGDPQRALQLVRRWVTRLALNEVAVEDYVITTELKNPNERVGQAVQPHVAVAWALEKACRGSEPVRGERVPWLLVRKPDPSRLVPPASKRTTGMDLHVPRTLSDADFRKVTLEQLAHHVVANRIAPTIPPAQQMLFFGDRNLTALPAGTTTLAAVGIQPGHRLGVVNAAAPNAARVEFRVWLEDGGQGGSDDSDDEANEANEDGGGEAEDSEPPEPWAEASAGAAAGSASGPKAACSQPAKRARPSASLTDRMMFHAREMTAAERASLGKRRVASDKAVSGLSAYARHPSELSSLRQEVDAKRYMDHVRSALEILLASTRPDLWDKMHRTLQLSEGVMDVTMGKPRQMTLAGFIRKA
jgi:DNA polymerase elongation subunit (family B)